MYVAQVIPAGAHPESGVPVAIHALACHLARRGHQVEVWELRRWTGEAPVLDGDDSTRPVVPRVAPGGSLWHTIAALGRRDVDLVHLHSVFTLPNALLASRLRAPYVLSPHGGYAPASLGRSAIRKKIYAQFIERRLARRAALRVALTETEAGDLIRFGANEPIAIIPN